MNDDIKVLIIEDDKSIRRFVEINLKRSGFSVFESESGEDGLSKMISILPDVVILDIMLPGIDGFEVCSKIRSDYPDVIIIILTALSQDMDKVMGLELGADDYMVKPFNPLELIARIRSILRRTKTSNSVDTNIIKSGKIEIDLNSQKVFMDNIEVEVTPREFMLLKAFTENPSRALNRDEILNLAWGKDFIGDYKTVDVHVRRLREKLEKDPSNPQIIHTVWGYGYRYEEVK